MNSLNMRSLTTKQERAALWRRFSSPGWMLAIYHVHDVRNFLLTPRCGDPSNVDIISLCAGVQAEAMKQTKNDISNSPSPPVLSADKRNRRLHNKDGLALHFFVFSLSLVLCLLVCYGDRAKKNRCSQAPLYTHYLVRMNLPRLQEWLV